MPCCRPLIAELCLLPRKSDCGLGTFRSNLQCHHGTPPFPFPFRYPLSTPYKRARTGVCSSWLASLKPGAEIPLSIRPGTFKLPELPHHPLIMVGPGTGVAPMRSVILERRHQRREALSTGSDESMPVDSRGDGLDVDEGKPGRSGTECSTAPDTLFFGCR